jgi:DinB superfamily
VRRKVQALYAAGPEALAGALTGLSEPDLDLAGAPGSWTTRQIVHHLADLEAATLSRVKLALAEPERTYLGNPSNPDTWAESLDYSGRSIGPSVELFRAIRRYVLQLVDHLPGAWDRASRNAAGEASSVHRVVSMIASHGLEHIEEIWETRRLHGR